MNKYDMFKTKKGTELPLMNLKGKPYMQVAQRLVWFTEDADSYSIESSFPLLTIDETVAHVIIKILDKSGSVVKRAEATKREDKKSFADHTEKAETGAIGRALAMLGYGTQFAIADLEEGDRLADSPIALVNKTAFAHTNALAKPASEVKEVAQTVQAKATFSKKAIAKPSEDEI